MRGISHEPRLSNWAVGLIFVAILALGTLFAFNRTFIRAQMPWSSPYEVKAVFTTAQNLRETAEVRIAGVTIGTVKSVEHLTSADSVAEAATRSISGEGDGATGEEAAVVTMEIKDEGRPIREDAIFKLRPRLFLEGNLFVDVKPGSPSAPEVDDGHTFGLNQTSNSVQLDQVLTTLQTDVRSDLQTFLDQFGNALVKHGGDEGFRELYRSSPGAARYTSQVNEALLGTEPHDLSGLVRNLDKVVRALGRNEEDLQGFVTNLRIFSGSFAAEDQALERAIAQLPGVLDAADPAFANLNASLPELRAFAREALPGTRSAGPALDAAQPWIEQVRRLVSEDELRGLIADFRPTVRNLAKLAKRNLPFLSESRALSSCFNEVFIPWSHDRVKPPSEYPLEVTGRVFEEAGYGLAGVSSESRTGDANGVHWRVLLGGGSNTVVIPGSSSERGQDAFGVVPFEILGAMPAINDSLKTPFRPNEPCEEQEPPDLGASMAPGPKQQAAPASQPAQVQRALDRLSALKGPVKRLEQLREAGDKGAAKRLERRIRERSANILGLELGGAD